MSDTASWHIRDLITAPSREQVLFLLILFLYLVITEIARRHFIRPVYQRYLLSKQRVLRANLDVLVDSDGHELVGEKAVKKGVLSLLDQSVELLEKKGVLQRLWEFWKPWSGAGEIGACTLIYEAEALFIDLLPLHEVLGRLRGKAVNIAGEKRLEPLAKRIDEHFGEKAQCEDIDISRALLRESIFLSNSLEESHFQRFITLLNKIGLLTSLGFILILPLGLVFGNLHLFLFGAVGGLLVPLGRIVRSKEMPTSYDFYWPSLLLMPLLGAFSGWVGVLLIDVFSAQGASVLGDVFKNVEWSETSTNKETLVAALFMGFASEWLEKLMRSPEDDPKPAKKDG